MSRKLLFVFVALLVLLPQITKAEIAMRLRLQSGANLFILREGGDYYFYHKGILIAEGTAKENLSACGVALDSMTATHRIIITGDRCKQTGKVWVLVFSKGLYTLTDSQKATKTGKG
jgi:hypothetical protein